MSTGQFGTYDLTEGTKLDVEDMIDLLDPWDVPLLGSYDPEGRRSIRKGDCTQIRPDWLDDTLLNPRALAAAAATTGATVLTVDDRLSFTTDHVVRVAGTGEYFKVDSYGTTADTLIISRAFSGSAATIASSADLIGVGTALAEGSDPNDGRYVDRSTRFNYTQIFGPYKIEVSATEQVIDKYGLTGTEMDLQVAKNVKQVGVDIEQAIMYGARTISTTNKTRTMGGFTQFITTNVDSTTTDLTEASLRTAAQTSYDAGGRLDWGLTNSTQKNKVSQFSETDIRFDRSERTRGQVVDFFESDFSVIWMMKSRRVALNDFFLYSADQPELCTLVGRQLQFERIGRTGDSEKGFLVCEKSLKFHSERHAYRFSALEA